MLDLNIFGRNRVTFTRQHEVTECGLACLVMVASFYRLKIDLITLRRQFPQSLQGTTLKHLIDMAHKMGLLPRAVKVPIAQLQALNMPAIVHWDLNHYVVLERVSGDRAFIHDPARGSREITLSELSNHFTGVALELRPGDNFVPGDTSRKLRFRDLWGQMKGFFGVAGQIILLSFFIEAFILISPYFTQIAIDTVLPSLDENLLVVLASSFGLFVIMSTLALALRGFISASLGAQIGFGLSVNVGQRLSRLPLNWFEKRKVGEILSRFLSVVPIQKTLTDGTLVGIVDGFLALATVCMMFFYSVRLALITLFATALYCVIRTIILVKMKAAQDELLTARASEQTFLIESIQGASSIRLGGLDMHRHSVWQTHLAAAINSDIRISRLTVWQNSANFAIFGIENIAIIGLGMSQVMTQQELTVGMLMAYLAYKSHFISKAASLLDQLLTIDLMSLHLTRLSDITQTEEDDIFNEPEPHELPSAITIELKDVTFGYVEGNHVVEGVSFNISPGEHIALAGPSGTGKSTVVKLLLGVVKPTSGEIQVNGVSLKQFGYRNLHSISAAVTQDDKLLNGSIRDNIAFFDPTATMETVKSAAMAASVHEEIMTFPMQYETYVGEMGSALSSGQRQRVLIARALFRKPKLLIMDEGTANVDEANEEKIFSWLRLTGASMLVISHKPSTIARAQKVVHLQDGKVVPKPEDGMLLNYEDPD